MTARRNKKEKDSIDLMLDQIDFHGMTREELAGKDGLLIALAQESGFEITQAEAEAYLAELENMELDSADLDKVAAGTRVCYAVDGCGYKN